MSVSVPKVKLNDGTSIPAIGFGTGTALYGKDCADLVLTALKNGYRYLDSAQTYGNGDSIRDALKRWDGKREDVYILTKMGKDSAPKQLPRDVLLEQLKLLGVDHVDLFLVHANYFAYPSLKENWQAMEELVKEGLTKSIGVSNYAADDIEEISKSWTIPPAVNQIEYNPYIYHPDYMLRLRSILDKHDIKIQAYAPMISLTYATDGPVSPVVKKIAESKGATEAQVLLAWAHQYGGGCAVTTSRNEQRQKEQLESLSKVDLSRSELEEIAEAGKGKTVRKYMHKAWQGKE